MATWNHTGHGPDSVDPNFLARPPIRRGQLFLRCAWSAAQHEIANKLTFRGRVALALNGAP